MAHFLRSPNLSDYFNIGPLRPTEAHAPHPSLIFIASKIHQRRPQPCRQSSPLNRRLPADESPPLSTNVATMSVFWCPFHVDCCVCASVDVVLLSPSIGIFVNGVWDSERTGNVVFDDSNRIRIVFAMAEAIRGNGGVFFIDFLHRQLTFCSVIDVTADFRPPELSPAVRARAHHAIVISITRGGSVAGERFNLVILIARGEGDGDPRGGREVSAVPSLFLYPRYFYTLVILTTIA